MPPRLISIYIYNNTQRQINVFELSKHYIIVQLNTSQRSRDCNQ